MGHIIFLKPYLSFCVSIVTTYTYITDPPQAVPIKNASAQCHSANRPNSEAKERLILGWENDKSEWPLKSTGFPYQAWVGLLSLGSQWGGQGGMGGVLPARAQLCPSGSSTSAPGLPPSWTESWAVPLHPFSELRFQHSRLALGTLVWAAGTSVHVHLWEVKLDWGQRKRLDFISLPSVFISWWHTCVYIYVYDQVGSPCNFWFW